MKTFICWFVSKVCNPLLLLLAGFFIFFGHYAAIAKLSMGWMIFAIIANIILAFITAVYLVKNYEEFCSMGYFAWSSRTSHLDNKIHFFFKSLFQTFILWSWVTTVIPFFCIISSHPDILS